MVICAIRACGDFYKGMSRADAWIESAELEADPDFLESVKRAELQLCEDADPEAKAR